MLQQKTSDWQIIETNDRRICASGLIELRRSASSAASIRLLNKHSQLVAQMRSRGGVPDVNAIHFSLLSRILIQYQQRGLSLPDWLNNETQKQIRQLAQESLQEMLQKPAIRALLVGPVLEKVKADLIRTALDFEPNDTLKSKPSSLDVNENLNHLNFSFSFWFIMKP